MYSSSTILKLLLIFFFSVITIGCIRSNEKYNEKWGLKSVEYEENLIFKNETYTHEIIFTPKISSGKYELRLFYPSIHYEKWFTSETDSKESNDHLLRRKRQNQKLLITKKLFEFEECIS